MDYSKIFKGISTWKIFMVAIGYSCVSIKLETAQKLRGIKKKHSLKSIARAIEFLIEKEERR